MTTALPPCSLRLLLLQDSTPTTHEAARSKAYELGGTPPAEEDDDGGVDDLGGVKHANGVREVRGYATPLAYCTRASRSIRARPYANTASA
uniref:Uncharacterized protein n=1 Tax=Oryza meridionalis TaxID=40149 RepID=A0A0E0E148_9ORYZ